MGEAVYVAPGPPEGPPWVEPPLQNQNTAVGSIPKCGMCFTRAHIIHRRMVVFDGNDVPLLVVDTQHNGDQVLLGLVYTDGTMCRALIKRSTMLRTAGLTTE